MRNQIFFVSKSTKDGETPLGYCRFYNVAWTALEISFFLEKKLWSLLYWRYDPQLFFGKGPNVLASFLLFYMIVRLQFLHKSVLKDTKILIFQKSVRNKVFFEVKKLKNGFFQLFWVKKIFMKINSKFNFVKLEHINFPKTKNYVFTWGISGCWASAVRKVFSVNIVIWANEEIESAQNLISYF